MRQILLIQLRQLGDILLTTPCIREIKRELPRATVTFLSHKMGKLILENNPYLDEFYTYDPTVSWLEEWRLMQHLRHKKYDLVIDFMNNPRSALYTMMTRSTLRYAFRSKRFLAYTQMIPRGNGQEYIVRDKFRLLESAGFQPKDVSLTLPWFERHAGPLMHVLGENLEFRKSPLRVVMSPTHRREARRWPLESYARLAEMLTRQWNAHVTWIWGPGEEDVARTVAAMCQVPTLIAPPTNFRECAAYIANSDLMIANSNGPSHVAVATDICTLQLHGPTAAQAWCPLTKKHEAVQSPSAAMADISVDRVWEKLQSMKLIIEAQAAKRQAQGVRYKWTVTTAD